MISMRALTILSGPLCSLVLLVSGAAYAQPAAGDIQIAAAPPSAGSEKKFPEESNKDEPSAEELMRRRHPQLVRVGDLIGLPVLDWSDSTIGFVARVVRTPEGKVQLIVPYSAWFGWARFAFSPAWGKRLVPVPIEKVGILARQLAALEMSRADFDAAPTWAPSLAKDISPDESIRIAITRR
jgi:hypothetical protein